jgi:Tol biopolymer transport system component/DNA-binding winged helix-turn-helix (wHTH) protein
MSDGYPQSAVYELPGYRLDPAHRQLCRTDGDPVEISAKVFDALVFLVRHAGTIVPREVLMAELWPRTIVEDNNLNKLIAALRRALDDRGEPRYVATVPGRGYQFVADVRMIEVPAPQPVAIAAEPAEEPPILPPAEINWPHAHPETATTALPGERRNFLHSRIVWLLAGALLAGGAIGVALQRGPPDEDVSRAVELRRLTNMIGNEESPAVAPDGRSVAFVAPSGGVRHVWLQLVSGGPPLQLTRAPVDHLEPRWAPDGSSLIYFTPAENPGDAGTVWEIPALGGEPRRLTDALAGGDISHDGRFLAVFRFADDRIELATLTRDGSGTVRTQPLEPGGKYLSPRWSPDDRWLAFQRFDVAFVQEVFVVEAAGGTPHRVASAARLAGFAWVRDGSGLIYSSSAGSTVLYPPTTNLHLVRPDGTGDRQLTFGDVSYSQPDVLASGAVVASRTRIQSDLWRFPVEGSALENTRAAVRITHQTGQVQTASVSPDGTEIAYLSDSGGHGNVWVARTDGSGARQVTFERDPAVSIGVPVWSSAGDEIAFIHSHAGLTGLQGVRADGSGLRPLVATGIGANWSGDGRWLYYNLVRAGVQCIDRREIETGRTEEVRCDNAMAPAVAADDSALYYVRYLDLYNGVLDAEIRKASPLHGESTVLATVSGTRVPVTPGQLVPTLSADGAALAMPLVDGETTNIWLLPTAGGPLRPLTDFGERSILIARRVAWSPDGRYVYASVAEVDSDIMLLDGLLR